MAIKLLATGVPCRIRAWIVFYSAFLATAATLGQDPLYIVSVTNVQALPTSTRTVAVELDNFGGSVQGWSLSVCHAPAVMTLIDVQPGANTLALNEGLGPDFLYTGLEADGANMLVVVCYTGCEVLPTGVDQELLLLTYAVNAPLGTEAPVQLCSSVGSPPTATLIVVSDTGVTPTTVAGTVTVVSAGFNYRAESVSAGYDPVTGAGEFEASLLLEEQPESSGFPNLVSGFSVALGHPSTTLQGVSTELGADLAALKAGAGPDFYTALFNADSLTIGCVFDFFGVATIQYAMPSELVRVRYATVATALAGDFDGEMVALHWQDGLGAVPTDNVVVVAGQASTPSMIDGLITLVAVPPLESLACTGTGTDTATLTWTNPVAYDFIIVRRDGALLAVVAGNTTSFEDGPLLPGTYTYELTPQLSGGPGSPASCLFDSAPSFRRGDQNNDGQINIADPVFGLNYLFNAGASFCLDAHDANDDGQVNIADPVYTLAWLFNGGPAMPAPFPGCGQDPTSDAIECDTYDGC
ncbi:MAG: hypothetical protein AB7O52_16225 [Planctomycetota bacterium]